MPLLLVGLIVAGCAGHEKRRRGPEEAHCALPPDHLHLRGQRRSRCSASRSAPSTRSPRPAPTWSSRCTTTTTSTSRPTPQAVIVVAVHRRRPLHPAHPGLRGRRAKLADGAVLDGPGHRRTARARPDLLQPRRPERRARPQRRQQERRAVRPALHDRRELRRRGRRSSTRPSRTSAALSQTLDDNKEALFGSGPRAGGLPRAPWRPTGRTGPPVQPVAVGRLRPALR